MDVNAPLIPSVSGATQSTHWETLVATLAARWDAWQQGQEDGDHAEDESARTSVSAAVRDLLQGLDADAAGASWAKALQAILALLDDPQARLPTSLATALVLTHERQADLRLRQLLAERDPAWAESVLAARATSVSAPAPVEIQTEADPRPMTGPDDLPDHPPRQEAEREVPQAASARNWWAVPVEGLSGSNQLFLLETRELLRSAELSLQALEREPGDYAEQMVLCRAFQAVAVAAASMGLHRLASMASEGERQFDQLLDEGGTAHAEILKRTDDRLQQLYAELLELVGEPAPEVVPTAVEAPVAAVSDGTLETVPPAAEAAPQAPEAELPAAPPVAPSPPTPPAEPKAAPWWWAVDWSAWSSDHTGRSANRADDAAGPDRVMAPSPTGAGAAPADASVRLSTAELHQWAETLWLEGHAEETRMRLIERLQEAACVAVDSWSVALFRAARREARERGSTADFDIEGGQIRLEASALQRVMTTMEAAIAARVAQGTGGALRLRVSRHHGGVRLVLGDGLDTPWPAPLDSPMRELAAWLITQGGDLRRTALEWTLDLPMTPTQWPVSAISAGAAVLWLPALWMLGVSPLDPELRARLLGEGSMAHEGQRWPVSDLAALIRAEAVGENASQLLLVQRGEERLALVVDAVAPVEWVRPLAWPEALQGLPARAGLWSLAQRRGGAPCALTDPFALHQRFGAAARVLVRSRARRSP